MVAEVDNAQDLKRIRYVTANYERLQGLRNSVPFGLMLLGMAGFMISPVGILFLDDLVFLLLLILFCGAGYLIDHLIRRCYYERKFGWARRAPMTWRQTLAWVVAGCVYCVGLVVIVSPRLPVEILLLTVGAGIFVGS